MVLGSQAERDAFLEASNAAGVMTRPVWRLMYRLAMFQDCQHDGLANSQWLEDRVVNLPSSVPNVPQGGLLAAERVWEASPLSDPAPRWT